MNKLENGNLKFTEEEVSQIMYEDGVYDEDTEDILFVVVSEKIIDSDTEKSSITKRYIIEDKSNGKFYAGELGKSPWYMQGEYNAKEEWVEVKPKQITKTVYE